MIVPGHGEIKHTKELLEGGLVHAVHHAHITDQEVQDATSVSHCKYQGGHCKADFRIIISLLRNRLVNFLTR